MGQRDRVVVVLWMVMLWQMGRCAERQEPLGCWAVRSFNFRQASIRTQQPVSWRSVAVHQGAPEPVVVARAMRRGGAYMCGCILHWFAVPPELGGAKRVACLELTQWHIPLARV